MSLDPDRLREVVRAARARAGLDARTGGTSAPFPASFGPGAGGAPCGGARPNAARPSGTDTNGIHSTICEAVAAAEEAFHRYREFPLQRRKEMISLIRRRLLEQVDGLSELAVEETGLGRVEDKRIKNRLVITKTSGPEVLVPESHSGDDGLVLEEWAPYGVIGAITPSTNPSETIINNGIAMLAGGNTVVFNAHPAARRVSCRTVSIINDAAQEAGAPRDLVTTIAEPTLESAQELMRHKGVRLLVVTGGPGVVRAALDSGKKCITGGPGNPPVIVDETADIAQAARDITRGGSLDNGIVCTCEKEIIVVEEVRPALLRELGALGNRILDAEEIRRVEGVIFEKTNGPGRKGVIRRELVGKTPRHILAQAGIDVPESCRLAILPVDIEHPLLWTEQLMPMMPLCSVPDADAAMELAVRMEGNNRHTFVMHSRRVDRLGKMARMCDASIFVKNGPNFAGLGEGGEGHTSFTIATPTGEGLTDARSFSRRRRCTLVGEFRIV